MVESSKDCEGDAKTFASLPGHLNLIYNQQDRVAEWVSNRLPGQQYTFNRCVTIGIERDSELTGGVVFFDWFPTWKNVYVAIAGEGEFLTRRILRCLYAFPFTQLGCERVTVLINEQNRLAVNLVLRIGFCLEGVMRGTPNCLVFGLLKKDAMKWA